MVVLAHPAIIPRSLVALMMVPPLMLLALRLAHRAGITVPVCTVRLAAVWVAALVLSALIQVDLIHIDPNPAVVSALAAPVLSLAMMWIGTVMGPAIDRGRRTGAVDGFGLVLASLVAAAALACSHALLQHVGLDPLPRVDDFPQRVVGPFSNPNHLGSLTAATLPIAAGLFLGPGRRRGAPGGRWTGLAAAAAVVMLYTGLLLAGSRGAMVAALAGSIVLFMAHLRRLRLLGARPRWLPLALLLLALAAVTMILHQRPIMQSPKGQISVGQRMQAVSNVASGAAAAQDMTIVHRRVLWRAAWGIFQQHPLAGVGPGNYETACARFLDDMTIDPEVAMLSRQHRLEALPYAHNELLHALAEGGLLVTIPFIVLIAAVVTGLLRRTWVAADMLPGVALATGAAVLVHALVSYPLYLPATAAGFWLLLGMALSRSAGHVDTGANVLRD